MNSVYKAGAFCLGVTKMLKHTKIRVRIFDILESKFDIFISANIKLKYYSEKCVHIIIIYIDLYISNIGYYPKRRSKLFEMYIIIMNIFCHLMETIVIFFKSKSIHEISTLLIQLRVNRAQAKTAEKYWH